jgi:hypothetical protein
VGKLVTKKNGLSKLLERMEVVENGRYTVTSFPKLFNVQQLIITEDK